MTTGTRAGDVVEHADGDAIWAADRATLGFHAGGEHALEA